MVRWRYATGLQVGTSHVRSGMPCQDRLICRSDGDLLVAAIADGAGSASYSDEGAGIVVNTIAKCLMAGVLSTPVELEAAIRAAVIEARAAVLRIAEERQIPAREFASTVLAVVANETGGACAHLGDGVIAVSEGGADWSYVFWPQRGEFANSTFFLTEPDALDRLNVDWIPKNVTDFALMSDGLEPLALTYATRSTHDPFFNALFGPLHLSRDHGHCSSVSVQLQELISSPRITARVDDDISVILATRRPLADST